MIEFQIISIEELKDLIYLSYENDTELVKRFHSINIDNEEHTLEECVDTTYDRIIEAGEEVEHDIFKVLYANSKIKVIDKLVFCCPSSAQSKLGPLALFATSLSNQLNLEIEIFYISVKG